MNTDDTYPMHCLRCARRAQLLRTVVGLSQWLILASFTVSVGFAASGVGREADSAYECARDSLEDRSLERQQLAAQEVALPAAQSAPSHVALSPRRDAALPLAAAADRGPLGEGVQGDPSQAPPTDAPAQVGAAPNDVAATPVHGADDESASREPTLNPGSTGVGEASASTRESASEPSHAGGDEVPVTSTKPRNADILGRIRKQLEAGRRSLRQGHFDEAEQAFRRALAIRRGHPQALTGLAHVYLARGDIERAKTYAQKAVQQAPYQAPYHIVLGDVLRVASDPQGAESHYRLASRLNPSRPLDRAARALPNPF